MKKIKGSSLSFVPASHEDPKNPGSLKKVLFRKEDFAAGGSLQMINWALLPAGKHFAPHYHEDMEEVFIIISGKARITIDGRDAMLEKGDAILIPRRCVHRMESIGSTDTEFIALGNSAGIGGKTIVVGE